jgi:hypothetical protein
MLSFRTIFPALLLATACAASRNELPEPWRVEVRTEGGFAGRGIGTFAIGSNGTVEVTTMQGKRCTFQASEEERRRFRELLTNARPEQWSASYVPPDPCCDRIEYTLTLEAGANRTTTWIDQPLPMPADLTAVAEAIVGGAESLRVTYDPRCQTQ